MRIEAQISTGRLKFEPYMGARTVYAALTLGAHTWWLMRWDIERAKKGYTGKSRMCWTCGHRKYGK